MSTLNIKIQSGNRYTAFNKLDNNTFMIEVKDDTGKLASTILDRSQAHLLMLYLQEHLNG